MASKKLPGHLASLLRHQVEPPSSSQTAEASGSGKAARKKAARAKRRARVKDDRAAERAEWVERKDQMKATKKEKKEPEPEVVEDLPEKKPLKKKKLKAREAKKTPKSSKPKAAESDVVPSYDPEGAARDEALMRDLERKLGLTSDKRRRKEEKQMFEDLGFDADDLGIEELPSSDEDAENTSDLQKDADKTSIVGLIDSILGQSAKKPAKPAKSAKIARAKGAKKKLQKP